MNIKDYLHLYLGCDMLDISDNSTYTLHPEMLYASIKDGDKPILRPLSDMTEDESEFVADAAWQGKPTIYMNAEITAYLLSKHFDLFGLIEAGLAIDKTKLH